MAVNQNQSYIQVQPSAPQNLFHFRLFWKFLGLVSTGMNICGDEVFTPHFLVPKIYLQVFVKQMEAIFSAAWKQSSLLYIRITWYRLYTVRTLINQHKACRLRRDLACVSISSFTTCTCGAKSMSQQHFEPKLLNPWGFPKNLRHILHLDTWYRARTTKGARLVGEYRLWGAQDKPQHRPYRMPEHAQN